MAKTQTALFAGGCFWGVEAAFRQIPGVVRTTVGYTGGQRENPSYEQVSTGATGHAEAIEVEFDPTRISYTELLDHFWQMHDPTQLDRQGPDVGRQYRSAIFYTGDEQKQQAEASKNDLAKSGRFDKPIVTEVIVATPFYPAEDYHQRFFEKQGRAQSTPELQEMS